jgi:tRNA threonylcarbamoyladenosine biosynthesis protein TsaB
MNLLALDTATEACSCALFVDGQLFIRYELAPRRHAERILPMLDEVLAEAAIKRQHLDAITFGCGPGSFTGLRIACGVVQGIAFGLNLPVVPVSCLAALAQGAYRECGAQRVMSAIDARMNEVYCALYEVDEYGIMRLHGTEEVIAPNAVAVTQADIGWGSGWLSYGDELARHVRVTHYQGNCYPQAQDLLPLALEKLAQGQVVSAAAALPLYLRNNVAVKIQDR